jgi:hypothetical protein
MHQIFFLIATGGFNKILYSIYNMASNNVSVSSGGELFDSLFGPLNKKYCFFFYFFGVLAFIMMIISIISVIYFLATKSPNTQMTIITAIHIVTLFFVYFQNRILHSMCIA